MDVDYQFKTMKHVFAVSAYRESPYLEECLRSLKNQRAKDAVIICTSTPNEQIERTACRYGYPVFVRDGESSLKADWNYAIGCAVRYLGAELVTVAHQDDIYEPEYSIFLRKAYELYPDMLIFCSRYATIDQNGDRTDARAEDVKRILRMGLRLRKLAHLKIIKRSALVFGNAICCPSVTYNISLTGESVFIDDDYFVTDWKALLRLADMPGRFVCLERVLLRYRVHPGAQTQKTISTHMRDIEEARVYSSLWPQPIAYVLSQLMHLSYGAYK